MIPVLTLEQAFLLIFVVECVAMKLLFGYSWIGAMCGSAKVLALLVLCIFLCAALGPLGFALDILLVFSAVVYSIWDEV